MTLLSYKVGEFKTFSYEEALNVSKQTNLPIEEQYDFYRDSDVKEYKEKIKNVSVE